MVEPAPPIGFSSLRRLRHGLRSLAAWRTPSVRQEWFWGCLGRTEPGAGRLSPWLPTVARPGLTGLLIKRAPSRATKTSRTGQEQDKPRSMESIVLPVFRLRGPIEQW